MSHPGRAPIRTGCDVQPVADVRDALECFGDRYLRRVYTAGEQAEASGRPDHLAGRFAAKEAVLKLIGTVDGMDPRWVEVLTGPAGRPEVVLHGPAAHAAARDGIGPIDLSVSHTTDLAIAVAVAAAGPPHDPSTTHAATTPVPPRRTCA